MVKISLVLEVMKLVKRMVKEYLVFLVFLGIGKSEVIIKIKMFKEMIIIMLRFCIFSVKRMK